MCRSEGIWGVGGYFVAGLVVLALIFACSSSAHRRAYGYRDQEYFTLRIYGLHETKYPLVG